MARLVHGSTDLLQPINLLPNSDFSRSGGYPATITYDSVSSSTSSDSNPVCESWYLRSYNGTFTNVTITRATNSLTITATLSSISGSEKPILGVGTSIVISSGETYTKIHKGETNGSYLAGTTAGAVYYSVTNKKDYTTIRRNTDPSSSKNFIFGAAFSNENIGDICTVTIMNPCVYEGAYTNPPIYKSLDVLPSNQFLYKGISGFFQSENSYVFTTTNNRIRIIPLLCYEVKLNSENTYDDAPIMVQGHLWWSHAGNTYNSCCDFKIFHHTQGTIDTGGLVCNWVYLRNYGQTFQSAPSSGACMWKPYSFKLDSNSSVIYIGLKLETNSYGSRGYLKADLGIGGTPSSPEVVKENSSNLFKLFQFDVTYNIPSLTLLSYSSKCVEES